VVGIDLDADRCAAARRLGADVIVQVILFTPTAPGTRTTVDARAGG
jgi:hypothetical protein